MLSVQLNILSFRENLYCVLMIISFCLFFFIATRPFNDFFGNTAYAGDIYSHSMKTVLDQCYPNSP